MSKVPVLKLKTREQSTIKFVNNPVFHSHTKHIDVG